MIDQPLDDLLARLERERLAADRLYHEALTALDRAVTPPPIIPGPPPPIDATRLPDLNRNWDLLPDGAPSTDRSLKGRLRGFVWSLVGPPLERQKQFNSALVDHINRNQEVQQQIPRSIASVLEIIRRELDALVRFESMLLEYFRTITLYIDTKDRSVGGGEIRERLALAEQRILVLKREVERRQPDADAQTVGDRSATSHERLDSPAYVGFEDRFRGSQEEIRARAEEYLPLLASASDIVDVGCGRGELLGLLQARGIKARGVDANRAMVESCRSRGFDVEEGDALSYLERQPEGSIGALVAIQVVEHFEPAYLMRFLETAYHRMRSGAPLILETINPACWVAFFDAYIRDLTHQRPLHPDTLKYLVEASGFRAADVRFRQPVREADRLPRVAVPAGVGSENTALMDLATALNAQADALNARLFSFTDYAVIARR